MWFTCSAAHSYANYEVGAQDPPERDDAAASPRKEIGVRRRNESPSRSHADDKAARGDGDTGGDDDAVAAIDVSAEDGALEPLDALGRGGGGGRGAVASAAAKGSARAADRGGGHSGGTTGGDGFFARLWGGGGGGGG
jgi:hypothetical protein